MQRLEKVVKLKKIINKCKLGKNLANLKFEKIKIKKIKINLLRLIFRHISVKMFC